MARGTCHGRVTRIAFQLSTEHAWFVAVGFAIRVVPMVCPACQLGAKAKFLFKAGSLSSEGTERLTLPFVPVNMAHSPFRTCQYGSLSLSYLSIWFTLPFVPVNMVRNSKKPPPA
jgi:hypothetical protein